MSDSETTYVAQINVTRTTKTTVQAAARGYGSAEPKTSRVSESFRLTVRAPSLEGVVEKISKHMSLVDDVDFGEERTTR